MSAIRISRFHFKYRNPCIFKFIIAYFDNFNLSSSTTIQLHISDRITYNITLCYYYRFDRSLAHMSTYITTESWVHHMEIDKRNDGNILFSDNHALKSTDGNITLTIAGQATKSGYREGIGESVRFTEIKRIL